MLDAVLMINFANIKESHIKVILCLLATIYPALRAANTLPAEALRYE